MSAQDDVMIKVGLDASGVKRELDAVRGTATTLDGRLEKVKKTLDSLGGKAGSDAKKAISSLSFAFGDMSGKVGGALDAVGDVAGALGSGSRLTIGLTAVGGIVTGLAAYWAAAKKEMVDFHNVIVGSLGNSLPSLSADIRNINAELDTFGLKGAAAQLFLLERDIGQQENNVGSVTAQLREAEAKLGEAMRTVSATSGYGGAQRQKARAEAEKQVELLKAEVSAREISLRTQTAELDQMKTKRTGLEQLAELQDKAMKDAEAEAKAKQRTAEAERKILELRGEQAESILGGASMSEWTPFSKWAKAEQQMPLVGSSAVMENGGLAGRVREVAVAYDEVADAATHAAMLQEAMWTDIGLLAKKVAAEMGDDMTQLYQGTFTGAVGATSSFFQRSITADADLQIARMGDSAEAVERAEEMKRQSFAYSSAEFLSGIGNELVGIGTKQIFEGAGIAIASGGLDPRGYALAALGGTAVAAGIGLGAAGTAVSAGADVAVAGAANRGAAADAARAERDRGVNRSLRGGGSGSGGDGGPRVVHIHYAVGGPQAEDVTREMARLDRVGRRRGMR